MGRYKNEKNIMNYVKQYKKVLVLPYIIDFRGYPNLSSKRIENKLTESDYLFWLEDSGRKIVYKTIKIKKDRISLPLRKQVFKKCGNFCRECKSIENLSVDHIYPESLGGKTKLSNLQILCRMCNSKKGNKIKSSEERINPIKKEIESLVTSFKVPT